VVPPITGPYFPLPLPEKIIIKMQSKKSLLLGRFPPTPRPQPNSTKLEEIDKHEFFNT
jgi:hypothetical protein